MKEMLKGFGSIIVGTALGSAAIGALGSAGSYLGEGIKGASQTLVAGGIFSNVYSNTKSMFKFK